LDVVTAKPGRGVASMTIIFSKESRELLTVPHRDVYQRRGGNPGISESGVCFKNQDGRLQKSLYAAGWKAAPSTRSLVAVGRTPRRDRKRQRNLIKGLI
jgi:hypothetical protein